MNDKRLVIIRIVCALAITLSIYYLFIHVQMGKIFILPFLAGGFMNVGENVASLLDQPRCALLFRKLFICIFLSYWFGFLGLFCYLSIQTKNFALILYQLPFWFMGFLVLKKTFHR